MDLYPTILDLVGVGLKPKQHLDGISLVPVLKGSAGAEFKNRPLAWTYPHNHGSGHSPSNAIRMGKWKLIQLTDDKTETKDRYELYDLQADVGESENLAIKHYDKTHQMAKRLSEWLESTLPEKPPRE
jgi:arylsulfatase A-like enzyme